MNIVTINQDNFESAVIGAKGTVLVDFWASWCGPCRMLAPEIEALAADHPELTVAKVNVDDNPALADRFGISAIPTVMVFKDGKAVNVSVGYKNKDALEKIL